MSVTVDKGGSCTVKGNTGNLEKTGYAFTKWNTRADGNGIGYSAGSAMTLKTGIVKFVKSGMEK